MGNIKTLKGQNIGHQNINALFLFLSKALGKNHIACYSVLHHDVVSLGMLCLLVVFMGC